MERTKNLVKHKEMLFLYLIFSVGIFGHLFYPLRELMLFLTPVTLLLTGTLVLFTSYKGSNKFLKWIILTYLLTFALEVIGVKTGLVFGEYKYGETLGLKLFEVPLIIGFNWILVILGTISVAQLITQNVLANSLIAATISVIFDLVLEPIAIKLDYWQWSQNVIPIQNYIAWFLIAFISALLFSILKVKMQSGLSKHYLLVQFIFFVSLLLFYS
ncbi:MAG: carotenoid biosynthesis protein [Ignavibacteriales bacterium]|nr:carotenoid biosynthesis protein [Ignavibacteriales bacterium]